MLANLFLALFLLAAVAGTLSSLGRVCVRVRERDRGGNHDEDTILIFTKAVNLHLVNTDIYVFC